MTDLIPLPSSGLGLYPTRVERKTNRALERVRAEQAVFVAQQTAKVESIAEVTETALLAVSHISAVEALLISRTPHAEARLRNIADLGAVGLADLVLKTHRRLP